MANLPQDLGPKYPDDTSLSTSPYESTLVAPRCGQPQAKARLWSFVELVPESEGDGRYEVVPPVAFHIPLSAGRLRQFFAA